jgi:hypothetical protein
MKITNKLKTIFTNLIYFFYHEFFKRDKKNNILDSQQPEKYLAKYMHYRVCSKIKVKINNKTISSLIANKAPKFIICKNK